MPPPWKTVAAYGLLAATLLACLYLIGLAPLSLDWGRELLGAAIAIVTLAVGLRLAKRCGGVASPARDARDASSTQDVSGAAETSALSARERQILNLLADGLSK